MSGIAGIVRTDGAPADGGVLSRMLAVVVHRGPGGAWRRSLGPAALGECRAAAAPEAPSGPPADDDLVIVFDGRIDNHVELRSVLRSEGVALGGASDAGLMLEAYRRWGPSCLELLLGDFAFGVWDAGRRRLFCARDPLGVKPLYYHFDGRRLVFGSEPRQVLEAPGVDGRPNLTLIGRYLLDDYSERRETLYRGVRRLEPGHALRLDSAGLRIERYWDVDPAYEIRYARDADYDAHFAEVFRLAVAARLRAPGTVGALLSGGLDSSSIVCTAGDLYRRGEVAHHGFETYSMLFDALPCDERRYIEAVVRRWEFPANYVHYGPAEEGPDLDALRAQPDVRYSPITLALIPALEAAQRKGVRVMLSGVGGDEFLASGFDHLTDLLLGGRLVTLVRQLRCDAELTRASAAWLCREYCVKPLLPARLRSWLRRGASGFGTTGDPDWLAPGFLDRAGIDPAARRREPGPGFPTRSQRHLYEVLLYNSNLTYAVGENDLLASRFSMEYRYPFLDRRVVEFLFAIPEEQRWWMERPKAVLRRALAGVLPEEVRRRPDKVEFSSVVDREVRGRLAARVEALIRDSVLARLGVVDRGRLLRRFRDFLDGRAEPASRWVILNFIGLELWTRSVEDPAWQRAG